MTREEWLNLAEQRALKLLDTENKAVSSISTPYRKELQAIHRELGKRYVQKFGSLYKRDIDASDLDEIKAWLIDRLGEIDFTDVPQKIITASKKAWIFGIGTAYLMMESKPPREPIAPPKELTQPAKDAKTTAQKRITEAKVLANQSQRWGDLTTTMAKATQAATAVAGLTGFAINRSAAKGVREAQNDFAGTLQVWICQPDACIICTPYDGQIVSGDAPFPGGLGPSPISFDDVPEPPLHGSCQCSLGVISWDDTEFATYLQGQADQRLASF